MAADRHAVPPGNPAAHASGTDAEEASGRALIQALRLRNGGNLCYANSWIRSVYWASTVITHGAELFSPLRHGFSAVCSQVRNGCMVQLMDTHDIRELLGAWTRPQDQHDVFEFAMYHMTQVGAVNLLGTWQARTLQDGEMATSDSGHVMILHPNRQRQSLHMMISAWEASTHAATCAFHLAPQLLLMQVMRFRNDSTGRLRRLQLAIRHVLDDFNVPVFTSEQSLEVRYQLYRPVACICHRGSTPARGHYTAVLIDRHAVWHCDDNVAPTRMLNPSDHHYAEVYAVLCVRKDV